MATARRVGSELVRALQEAVLAEVAERGYAATTYDGIAERAGTSKPVLYRRWPTKGRMVLEALVAVHPVLVVPPDSGSLAGDLTALLTAMRSIVLTSDRRTVLSLLAELDGADGVTVRDLLFLRGVEIMESLVERGRARGELGRAAIPARLLVVPLDLARHDLLVDDQLTDENLRAIVEEIAMPLLLARSRWC